MAMIHHAMPLSGGQTIEKQFSGRATKVSDYSYQWKYTIPLTDAEAAQYTDAVIKDLLVHASHDNGLYAPWTYINSITISQKSVIITGTSQLKNDSTNVSSYLNYVDISGILILFTKAAKLVGIQPVKCSKTNSHYAYYVFGCHGINEIAINASLSNGSVLYIRGSNDPDEFMIGFNTDDNIKGAQIRTLSASGYYVVDTSGYDYINLDFINPTLSSAKKYNATGSAVVTGAQLLYVQ